MVKAKDTTLGDETYLPFIPHQILSLIGKKSIADIHLGDQVEKRLTILFSDIRGFTSLSEKMSPEENFSFINSYLKCMEPIILSYEGIIDKYIGDGIMAIFPKGPQFALDCAIAMSRALDQFNESRKLNDKDQIEIGIGINTGLSMLGMIGGGSHMEGTVISDAVNLASRIESTTKEYHVRLLVSENTFHGIEDSSAYKTRFIDRILVKGKKDPQSLYEVYNIDSKEQVYWKSYNKHNFEEALACYHYKQVEQAKNLLRVCLENNPDDKPAKIYYDRCLEYEKRGLHYAALELGQVFEWSSEFEIGDSLIDQQHHDLLDQANKLVSLVKNQIKKEEVSSILNFLEEYAQNHFSSEEELMKEVRYPFLNVQVKQHRTFIHNFLSLKKELQEMSFSQTYLLFRTQIFLVDWLVNHTLKEDKHLGKFIQRQNRV